MYDACIDNALPTRGVGGSGAGFTRHSLVAAIFAHVIAELDVTTSVHAALDALGDDPPEVDD